MNTIPVSRPISIHDRAASCVHSSQLRSIGYENGEGPGQGYNVNIALPAGSGGYDLHVLRTLVPELVEGLLNESPEPEDESRVYPGKSVSRLIGRINNHLT